jgi:ferrochelatase
MEPLQLAVVLMAYGGPQSLDEVEPFLRRVIAPREPTPELRDRTLARYEAIGGSSPLIASTRAQAAALEAELRGPAAAALASAAGRAVEPRVFVGMRSTPPFIDETLTEALAWGGGHAFAVIMASHQSPVATGAYERAVTAFLEDEGAGPWGPDPVSFLRPWSLEVGYLDAVADRIDEALARLPPDRRETAPLLFSAHSLPVAHDEEDDMYEAGLRATAEALVERVGMRGWRLGFQSAGSRAEVLWLGPDTAEVLREMHIAGHREVVVVPLGFVVEHVETLYDLDIELRAKADEFGLVMERASTVQDHPAYIAALADALVEQLPGSLPGGGS